MQIFSNWREISELDSLSKSIQKETPALNMLKKEIRYLNNKTQLNVLKPQ